MSLFVTLAVWVPIAFFFVVAATYVGTKLALRSYFEWEDSNSLDSISIDERKGD